MDQHRLDIIPASDAHTLTELLQARVKRSPEAIAYRFYSNLTRQWEDLSWHSVEHRIQQWQRALQREGLQAGDKLGIMLRNCPEWVICEHAAFRLGLVVVPLFVNDRPDNVSHIVNQAEIKLMLIENREQWLTLCSAAEKLDHPLKVISLDSIPIDDPRLPRETADDWLLAAAQDPLPAERGAGPDELATIVYTSGTTGLPKGVMLSHRNILDNARASLASETVYTDDVFLSFLPLSHTLERTAGLYIPMLSGATVAFCRAIPYLAEDLLAVRPTLIISVPRTFERVYGVIQQQLQQKPAIARWLFKTAVDIGWQRFEHQQGRAPASPRLALYPLFHKLVGAKILAKFGGRMRFAISGGAPLPPSVARTFIGLGLPLLQGYGLTEASPVISVNSLKANRPDSIGHPIEGVEVRLAEDGELQTRSTCVMQGYWKNEQATRDAFTEDGWLKTGDLARIDEEGYIYITGRKKEILVLGNGEKIAPVDMEMALTLDPWFDQALVIGEGRPFLAALLVLNPEQWQRFAQANELDPDDPASLEHEQVIKAVRNQIAECTRSFPGYAQIRRFILTLEPWTDSNGLLTPTLKLKRARIMEQFAERIEALYGDYH